MSTPTITCTTSMTGACRSCWPTTVSWRKAKSRFNSWKRRWARGPPDPVLPPRYGHDNDRGRSVGLRFDAVARDQLQLASRASLDVASGVMNAAAGDATVGTVRSQRCGKVLGLGAVSDQREAIAVEDNRTGVVAGVRRAHVTLARPAYGSHEASADRTAGGVWPGGLAAGALTADQVA